MTFADLLLRILMLTRQESHCCWGLIYSCLNTQGSDKWPKGTFALELDSQRLKVSFLKQWQRTAGIFPQQRELRRRIMLSRLNTGFHKAWMHFFSAARSSNTQPASNRCSAGRGENSFIKSLWNIISPITQPLCLLDFYHQRKYPHYNLGSYRSLKVMLIYR